MFHTKVLEKIKANFFRFSNFFPENRAVYKNVAKYGIAWQATDDNIIRRMRFAGWITKATKTPSEYKILINFPLQQWLLDRPTMLRYT
jgi:hypothetical protein